MRSVSVLVLGLALCFFAGPALGKVLYIDQFPHFQTFDSWDLCYYDGTCYENRCDDLSAGWYNPEFRAAKPDPPSIRHWWVIDEQTPSNWDLTTREPVACSQVRTGPCSDHTSGTPNGGKYLYAESTACFGVNFEVRTPTFMFNNSGAQISFWYYMSGDTFNNDATLSLDLSVNNGSWSTVWSENGDQGAQWTYVNVEVAAAIGNNATSSEPTPVTFRFIAITSAASDAFYSDIALDDIYVTQDGAPNTSEPYIEPNDTKPPPILPSPKPGKESGDGLTDAEIAGIVVGIVGGACCLCCLLCLCLIALLLIISPRKPPEEQASGGGL